MKFIQLIRLAAWSFLARFPFHRQASLTTAQRLETKPAKKYCSEIKRRHRRAFSGIFGSNAALVLASIISGCGGGVSSPPDTTPVATTPLAVSPVAADIFPDVPVTFTITGGKPTYSAFTSNSVVLPVTATVTGSTFTVIPGPVTAETPVDITVRDSLNVSAAAKATVKPSTLINQITFTPSAPTAAGCGTGLCSGNDAQVVVKAALNGIVLRGRQIRFDAFQGAFQIVTPGTNVLVNSLIAVTDANGEAVARVIATAGAPTQVATLAVSDVSGGQSRKYSFNIIQQTSGVGVLTTLPSDTVIIKGAQGVAGTAQGAGRCPVLAQVDYLVFGGTPPYTVGSSRPDIASVAQTVVDTNGGRFSVTVRDCGQAAFIVTDSSGRTIQTAIIDSQRGDNASVASGTNVTSAPLSASPSSLIVGCNSSASVTLSGSTSTATAGGTFAAAISTSIPSNPVNFSMSPSTGRLPGTLTFTRTNIGTVPATISVSVTDGATIIPLTISTQATCP